ITADRRRGNGTREASSRAPRGAFGAFRRGRKGPKLSAMTASLPDRRRFLKSAGLLAGAVPFGFPAITSCQSPNSKLNLGLIALGGCRRAQLVAALDAKENIVALVDVDENHLGSALEHTTKARSHKDLRAFFGKMDDIDAVIGATTE